MAYYKKEITKLPTTPGVYLYKDDQGVVIYVGKAVNLKRRVKQYFEKGHELSPKTQQLVAHIAEIDHISTVTEFDALLLEATLIRKYQPKYNSIAKDDKSPIYIQLALSDLMPRITLTRKPKEHTTRNVYLAGPFQSTRIARSIMRSIRRCVPYCTQKTRTGKPCFYTHIGLCSPCPSEIVGLKDERYKKDFIKQYRKNIYRIKRILEGKLLPVVTDLEKEMEKEAKVDHFEEAAILRDRMLHMRQLLTTHFDPSMYVDDSVAIGETVETELQDLLATIQNSYPFVETVDKIECVDISNTSGTDAVGSLVVMEKGVIDRAQYRRFSINDITGPNDTAMIYQVVSRRFKHPEWTFPCVLLIDGGKGQVAAAERALQDLGLSIPVIGLAKRYESLVMRVNGIMKLIHMESRRPAIRLLKRIRDESHRFAISYHKVKRANRFSQSD